jgi:hypothetical protein
MNRSHLSPEKERGGGGRKRGEERERERERERELKHASGSFEERFRFITLI